MLRNPKDPSRLITLKLSGLTESDQHDNALRLLENVGQAILFEMDLRYGFSQRFSPISAATRSRRVSADGKQRHRPRIPREVSDVVPTLPEKSHPTKPLALYWYARSAVNMPLLQYLASYQVLEYDFPVYYQREVLDRIKQELLDPRFSAQNDGHLNKLFSWRQPRERDSLQRKSSLGRLRECASPWVI